MERYETVKLDLDLYSDSTSSVVSVVFPVGWDSVTKRKETEHSDSESNDGSNFLGETIREGWQEMVALCEKITDAEEGRMVGFLLLVVSNVCRMESTQAVHLCCGLGDDCVVVGMDKIGMGAREVCSLADDYEIMTSELDDKWQEVGDLEQDVKELGKTITKLKGEVRFQRMMREEYKKNSGTKSGGFGGPVGKMQPVRRFLSGSIRVRVWLFMLWTGRLRMWQSKQLFPC